RHVPVVGLRLAGHVFAALHILRRSLTASHIGAHRAAGNRAADGGYVIAAPAADLVTEHAADYRADNCAGDVVLAAVLDLFLLDPAALLGRRHDRAHRCHVGFVYALVVAPPIVVRRQRS